MVRGQQFGRGQVFPNHVHNAPPTSGRHARVIGIWRRDAGGAWQGHAQGLGHAHHGGGCAHGHAGAVAAGNPALNAQPLHIADFPGTSFVPVFPSIRARAQGLPLPVAAQHGPSRQVNARHASRDGPHQQTWGGFVATAHQHGAIDGVAANQLFGFHGQHVAVQHGGRAHKGFGQRNGRKFQGKAAGLKNAAFDVFHPLLEVGVTRVDVRPRVHNGNHRFAGPVLRGIAHLHGARAVAKRAQVVWCKPTGAAQLIGVFGGVFQAHARIQSPTPGGVNAGMSCEGSPSPVMGDGSRVNPWAVRWFRRVWPVCNPGTQTCWFPAVCERCRRPGVCASRI